MKVLYKNVPLDKSCSGLVTTTVNTGTTKKSIMIELTQQLRLPRQQAVEIMITHSWRRGARAHELLVDHRSPRTRTYPGGRSIVSEGTIANGMFVAPSSSKVGSRGFFVSCQQLRLREEAACFPLISQLSSSRSTMIRT